MTMTTDRLLTLTLNASEDTLEVEYEVPLSNGRTPATYSEEFAFGPDLPQRVRDAARELSEAVSEMLQHPPMGEVPCGTCRSTCCRDYRIFIYPDDVPLLLEKLGRERVEKHVVMFDGTLDNPVPTFHGAVGELRKGEGDEGCLFLGDTGCSIYPWRPRLCREYIAHNCGDYAADPVKVAGRVSLPVW